MKMHPGFFISTSLHPPAPVDFVEPFGFQRGIAQVFASGLSLMSLVSDNCHTSHITHHTLPLNFSTFQLFNP